MDTNQLSAALASALVRVVEAARPAQEYCLLWIDWWPTCMTKAEWAGWAQTAGVVAALMIPWLISWKAKWRAKPVALDVYRQALGWSKDAKRLQLLVEGALRDPAQLKAAHDEGAAIVRSRRDFAEDEVGALKLVAPVAANRLRACIEIRAKLAVLFGIPVNDQSPHLSLHLLLQESLRHAKEFQDQTSEVVDLAERSGLKIR
ncbi:MAG: hypothetical protein F9K35_13680 [Burkholderiaceae bacterium]|nr:MAG: hypothetical protein F9K35_13680 [Burkholderiaceae bacterium]